MSDDDDDRMFIFNQVDNFNVHFNRRKQENIIERFKYSQERAQRNIMNNSLSRIRSRSFSDNQQEKIVSEELRQYKEIRAELTPSMQPEYNSSSYSDESISNQRSLSQNQRSANFEAQPLSNSKERMKASSDDYQKNIPGYITKACLKAMLSHSYLRKVQRLCQNKKVNLQQVNNLIKRLRQISNISLNKLFIVLKDPSNANEVFRNFFSSYLRKRYTIYLIKQGKMLEKNYYIGYKKKLLYLQQTQISFKSNPNSTQQEIA